MFRTVSDWIPLMVWVLLCAWVATMTPESSPPADAVTVSQQQSSGAPCRRSPGDQPGLSVDHCKPVAFPRPR